MKDVVTTFLVQTSFLAKFFILSYSLESSRPIRLQDSLNCYISRENKVILFIGPPSYGGSCKITVVSLSVCLSVWHFSQESQPAMTCLKLTIETLEQGVKYVQS